MLTTLYIFACVALPVMLVVIICNQIEWSKKKDTGVITDEHKKLFNL